MRFLMLVLLAAVMGCGGDDPVSPADAARAELESRGIEYTAEAFLDAAAEGNLAVVRLVVDAGMSVDATGSYGLTALHLAVDRGHLAVVEFLVGAGASLAATDNEGRTPRDLAEDEGHGAVADYLESVGG